jgi:hypothetical protein
VKAIPSCGGDLLHRHSRVAGFDDIFDFGLEMYQFYFSCVFCELFKCNTIAFERGGGGVNGTIVKGFIVICLEFLSCTLYIVHIIPNTYNMFRGLITLYSIAPASSSL